ncbi:MAG: imidazoleglycerol-phosphate dehydratase [Pseudomonadota bacterium]
MAAIEGAEDGRRTRARIRQGATGANVETGIPAFDHLLRLTATYGGFALALEVAPGGPLQEVADAGRAVGDELAGPLRADGVRGLGSAVVPADEALAHVSLEASGRPLLVSNVDLSQARVGGLDTDAVARFLEALADAAGLTVHVRLLEGTETQHVLDAIFKALGVALAQALRPKP